MSAEWKRPCWNVLAEPGGLLTCGLTWCCPCITYGINVAKLGDAKAEVMCSGQFTQACLLYCCIGSAGCPCVVHIPTRQYIRKKYGVKGPQFGLLEELLMTWCCSCCAIVQDYNEIAIGEGVAKGGIVSELKKATETATADAKKEAKAVADSVAATVQKKDETGEEKETKEAKEEAKEAVEAKEVVVETKAEAKEEEKAGADENGEKKGSP